MTPLETAGLSLFILVLFLGLFATVFSFPGTVIIVAAVVLYSVLTGFEKIGLLIILILLILSILAEAIDFALGMAGAARIDSSRRAVSAAVAGGCAGAVIMTPFLLGLGTLLGMFFGGLIGSLSVELIRQRNLKPSLRLPFASILSRVFAIVVKGGAATSMIIIVILNIYS